MTFSKTNKDLSFSCLPFSALSSKELYQIIQLREKVFIVEQECAYLDCDSKDIPSYHLSGFLDKNLIAYARLVPIGISYDNFASIGRIVVNEKYRSLGIGKKLVEESIRNCHKLFPNKKIKISAQCYLKSFYQELGFTAIDDEYQEDGIPHIAMIFTS